jgi:hypothetical protein
MELTRAANRGDVVALDQTHLTMPASACATPMRAPTFIRTARARAGLLAGLLCCLPKAAGDLTRADVERRFARPLHVGEKLREMAAWPLTSELQPAAAPRFRRTVPRQEPQAGHHGLQHLRLHPRRWRRQPRRAGRRGQGHSLGAHRQPIGAHRGPSRRAAPAPDSRRRPESGRSAQPLAADP